ncbi:hypothetical protein L9F63_007587 [Diploptera punctata]|uniref:Uncharacterized protein n=1 Tax=Diploptera punctata TaxID=6984 RepID=A0AAD8E3H0_DIPPU|nr:hypothetical protein L9F63_007587 [Diploptera punctata]
MDQIKQAAKMIRNVCQPKTGVATEVIDQAGEGVFAEDDRNFRCYAKCVMQMTQAMGGNGKLKPDSAINQAKKLLPLEMRDRTIASIEKCRDVDKEHPGLDPCDLALEATKCFYNSDPEAFMFP